MSVIPMYPLIGIWGSDVKEKGKVRFSKEYAAMKLTIYLTLGAVIALIGLLWLYASSGIQTFDLVALERHLAANPLPASPAPTINARVCGSAASPSRFNPSNASR